MFSGLYRNNYPYLDCISFTCNALRRSYADDLYSKALRVLAMHRGLGYGGFKKHVWRHSHGASGIFSSKLHLKANYVLLKALV